MLKRGAEGASYVAFDLLRLDGVDLRQNRIEDPRKALTRELEHHVQRGVRGRGRARRRQSLRNGGLEGIVSKRAGSLYRSGTGRQWLKLCKTQRS